MTPLASRARRALAGLVTACAALAAVAVVALAGGHAAGASTRAGTNAAVLAYTNYGGTACGTNSVGEHSFGSSCTGNSGQPEYWCADFVKWAWGHSGIVTTGLTAAAGSFYTYGNAQGTLHTEQGYSPSVGDAIVYNYAGNGYADHVGIVTAVLSDGSLATANGDFGGQSGTQAHFAATSTVERDIVPAAQVHVGGSAVGYRISAFVSPRTLPVSSGNLLSDGNFEAAGTGPWQCTVACGADHGANLQHSGTGNGWVRHDSGWADIHQTVAVTPRTTYHLTGWLRTSNNSDNGFFGVRNTPTAAGATVLGEEHFGNIDGYTYLQQDVDSGTNTSLTVYAGVWTDHGDIYLQLDDLSLQAI